MKWYFLPLICILHACNAVSQATYPVGTDTLTERIVTTNLHVPWEIIWGPDDHIWMTERDGKVSRIEPVSGTKSVILTIADVDEIQESGLLGMVLHPNFTDTPHVFLVYTYDHPTLNTTEKVVRYTYTGGVLTSPLVLIDSIDGANIHNGSRLLISADRKLFISTGDAATGSRAQDTTSLNGKILRINLDGSIPADNPYAGSRLWSIGHRNAQGLVTANGIMYSSEHGPTSDDEFNIIEKKRNYGWPTVAGFCNTAPEITFCAANNVKEPLSAWTPTLAVAGITYYNHPAIALWQHSVLMTTLKAEKVVQLKLNGAGDSVLTKTDFFKNAYGRFRNICVSPYGSIFVTTSNTDAYGTPNVNDDKLIEFRNLSYVPAGVEGHEKKSKVMLYPSPGSGEVYIRSEVPVQEVEWRDMQGKLVLREAVNNALLFHMPVSQLPRGLYTATIILEHTREVIRWMKD